MKQKKGLLLFAMSGLLVTNILAMKKNKEKNKKNTSESKEVKKILEKKVTWQTLRETLLYDGALKKRINHIDERRVYYDPTVAIHPDNSTIAYGYCDNYVKIFNKEEKKERLFSSCSKLDYGICSIDYNSDGDLLVVGINYYDEKKGETIGLIHKDDYPEEHKIDVKYIDMVKFNNTGQVVVVGDNKIMLYDIPSKKIIKNVEDKDVQYISHSAYSQNKGNVVSGSNKCIKLWDVMHEKCIQKIDIDKKIESLAYSPDGNSVAAGYEDVVKIWDVNTKKQVKEFKVGGDDDPIESIIYHPDGNRLIFESDDIIYFGDLKKEKIIGKLEGNSPMALSRDGNLLATKEKIYNLKLFDKIRKNMSKLSVDEAKFLYFYYFASSTNKKKYRTIMEKLQN